MITIAPQNSENNFRKNFDFFPENKVPEKKF